MTTLQTLCNQVIEAAEQPNSGAAKEAVAELMYIVEFGYRRNRICQGFSSTGPARRTTFRTANDSGGCA